MHSLTFADSINLLTKEVECNLIPDSAKAVIRGYARNRNNSMFYGIFLYHIGGVGDWDGVVDAYDDTVHQFNTLVSSLSDG